jgi:serine/threonine-protein kinase
VVKYLIGRIFDNRYQLIAKIGSGGMADVYLALDLENNNEVAIKVLHAQLADDSEFVKRFRREAEAATRLNHNNIVKIYSIGEEDNSYYIVMEYVKGDTLKGVLNRQMSLPIEEAVAIVMQITDALIHAHQNKVIHRDIKPHNILYNNGEVKITDFGIARTITQSTITHTGSVLGSIHYLSPEQARGGWTDEKTDIYSLGIVFYQMLTGQLPFMGETPISVILKHLEDDYVYPREIRPEIPQSVENVIRKMLEKNPRNRYSSSSELKMDLATVLSPVRLNEPTYYNNDKLNDEEYTRKISSADRKQDLIEQSKPNKLKTLFTENKYFKYGLPIFAALIIIALVVSTIYFLSATNDGRVKMPNLVKVELEKALETLEPLGLRYAVVGESSETIASGLVIRQEPQANIMVNTQSEVTLYVSTGIKHPKMPDLINKQENIAVFTLKQLGVRDENIKIVEGYSESFAKGLIYNQSPYSEMDLDLSATEVVLYISMGSDRSVMPELQGVLLTEAQAILLQRDIVVEKIVREKTVAAEKGQVFRQEPFKPGDEITVNDKVTLYVSDGLPDGVNRVTKNIMVTLEGFLYQEVRIEIYDSRYRNILFSNERIRGEKQYAVELILRPDDIGTITVYVNNKIYYTTTVNYFE